MLKAAIRKIISSKIFVASAACVVIVSASNFLTTNSNITEQDPVSNRIQHKLFIASGKERASSRQPANTESFDETATVVDNDNVNNQSKIHEPAESDLFQEEKNNIEADDYEKGAYVPYEAPMASEFVQTPDESIPFDNKKINDKSIVSPSETITTGGVATPSTANTPKEDDKNKVDIPTSNTNTSSNSGGATAIVQGRVAPLKGLISLNDHKSLFVDQVYASNTCSSPRVLIFDLATKSIVSDNPLDSKNIDSTTKFQFNPTVLGLNLNTPSRYLIKTVGCINNYERIITSFYADQDLTPSTTLLSKSLNSAMSLSYSDISITGLASLIDDLDKVVYSDASLETVYHSLDSSNEMKGRYSNAFGGVNLTILKDSAPDIESLIIPKTFPEKSNTIMTVLTSHWFPSYQVAYEWRINGNLISTTASAGFTPEANSLKTAQLQLIIGQKNTNDSFVNRSLPHHQINSTLDIIDTYPVTMANVALVGTTLVNSEILSLDLQSGAVSGSTFSQCETFSSFAISETNVIPSSSSFTRLCNAGPTQNLSYTLLNTIDGPHTLYFFAKDIEGKVSAPKTVSLLLDKVGPILGNTQAVSTNEDTAVNFNLAEASDENPLTYIVLSQPASGTLSCVGGSSRACTYTPIANFNGNVTFTYKATNGTNDSSISTVTITVNSVNDLPVIGANQTFSTNDNTALNFTINSGSDVDLPAQTLSYKVITAPAHGTLSNCISTGAYSTDLTCTYTSIANYNGSDSFTYVVNDGIADSLSTATVTFNVTDVTPPAAPTIILASTDYTNSLSSAFTATSCSGTDYIFINEGAAPSAGSAGWVACSTGASALTYTMSAGAATKSVKLWSKDANGNVSIAPATFSIVYETTAPAITLTQPSDLKGGTSYSFAWTATETNITASQNFTVEYFNGTSWSTLGTKAATAGPLSSAAFSYAWNTSVVNITNAKFRVSVTDRAGNTGTATSSDFVIDSLAPSIAITSPANSTAFATTNATIVGTCEGNLPITFSGALQADFTINCSSGSFSQVINFSTGDGSKAITLTHTDIAGNSSTATRSLTQDTTAPALARTTGANPQNVKTNTVTWGGTCEGNLAINYTGSSIGSFNCVSGAWSWTTPSQSSDGAFTYSLKQSDAAGNTSSALGLSWTRDNIAPDLTVTQGTGATNNLNQITLSGNCEGVLPINITGAATSTFTCNNGTWTYTSPVVSTDSTRTYTITQADAAGNSTVKAYAWVRNTQGPALFLSAASTLKTNTNTVIFSGTCESGLTINITGEVTTTTTCSSGIWSYTTATQSTDGSRTYNFTQTNAVPNSTTVSSTWIRKTNLPTVSGFTTTASSPTKNAVIPTEITVASNSVTVFVSDICTKSDVSTQPTAADNCWVPVNGSVIGKSPASNMVISNYSHLMGWIAKSYSMYLWVKDEAGNISALTNSGVGTINTDKLTMVYDPGVPPVVSDVLAANVDTTGAIPTINQATVVAGSTVYIRWKATDDAILPVGTISLNYTTDDLTFSAIAGASALSNQNYGCPNVVLSGSEGCFKWTNGSPLTSSYKIQVTVKDQMDLVSKFSSNPLNPGSIQLIAGNTETGLGGSAKSAMFYTNNNSGEADVASMVMTSDGRMYFADLLRGIVTVDPKDGNQKIFIRKTGTSTGDGGPASSATLANPLKIALDFQNRLLIFDINRIRRVDLNQANPTIETIIGGGSDVSDTVANPLNLSIVSHPGNNTYSRSMTFFTMPNGDIYFHSESSQKTNVVPTYRIRIYKGSTGQVTSKYFDLSGGDYFDPSTPISGCQVLLPLFRYNPSTSTLTGVSLSVYHNFSYPSCSNGVGSGEKFSRAYFDPITFAPISNQDAGATGVNRYFGVTGMNGVGYIMIDRTYVHKINYDGTYTRILGSGTLGACPDGTANLSCAMTIQDLFVTSSGKMYFLDAGVVRTIDDNGKVISLFGQLRNYGDGINAKNARFNSIGPVMAGDNGAITVGDMAGFNFKEFTIGGNVNLLAGNGNNGAVVVATNPKLQGLTDAGWMAMNPITNDIYARGTGNRLVKLNRSTGLWEYITGCGANEYYDNDNQNASNLTCTRVIYPILFYDNKLVVALQQTGANNVVENFMWKTFDITNSYKQTHLSGIIADTTSTGGYDGICASGTPTATCRMSTAGSSSLPYWDAPNNRIIFARRAGFNTNSFARQIYSMTAGGNVTLLATLARYIYSSYTYVKEGSSEFIYYCDGSRIYKHNLTTDTDMGGLNWPIPNLTCKGQTIQWNATNRTLLFPYAQNTLSGVALYYVP